ncbi:hypothetical protein [Streptomyces sp. NPDC058989]|uniref:hypothetical protein n=1 Tax=Streptomyces sp. NPDC058989 TaxID=3346686 RepID=UPI00369D1CD1
MRTLIIRAVAAGCAAVVRAVLACLPRIVGEHGERLADPLELVGCQLHGLESVRGVSTSTAGGLGRRAASPGSTSPRTSCSGVAAC